MKQPTPYSRQRRLGEGRNALEVEDGAP